MWKKCSTALMSLAMLASAYAQGAAECGSPTWVQSDYKNGTLKVTLKTVCNLEANQKLDYSGLSHELQDQVTTSPAVKKVFQGPTPHKQGRFEGVHIDSQIYDKDSNGELWVRSDHYVLVDHGTRLLFKSVSKEVKGKGNSKYTVHSEGQLEVFSQDGVLIVERQSTSHVKKPGFAPKGLFVKMAKEGLIKKEKQRIPHRIDLIKSHLEL